MNDIHGFFFIPPITNNYIGHQFAEVYRDQVYLQFMPTVKGGICLDIGGNLGVTSYYFANFFEKVYTLEPSLEHFDILTRMLKFNKIKNVVPIKKALFIKSGELPLFHNPNKTMFSLHSAVADPNLKEELVDCITIQGLLDEYKIDKVDFMKLDIEGSEVEILSHTSFKNVADRIKALVVERHAWNGRNENQLVDALKSVGFEVGQIPNQADLIYAKR